MERVRQLLSQKGTTTWSIGPDRMVYRALELMNEKGIGALLVTDGEQIVGIITERDYARKVILQGKSSKETSVREVMTSNLYAVNPDTSVEECMALMTERRIRHLPVFDKGKLAGIISIGDVLKAIIDQQGTVIKNLQDYIMGKYT
jgi:CBS domain-containing protein